MEGLWKTLLEIFVESREYREAAMVRRQRYLLPTLLLSTIPLWLVLIMLIRFKIEAKREAYLKARGTYLKEKPIKEMSVSFGKKKREKEGYGKNSVLLTYKVKRVKTKGAEAYAKAMEENKKLKQELLKEIISIIPKEELCLVARSGSVYKNRKAGEIKPEEERSRSFRLDLCNSWEKKKNDEWLKEQRVLLTNQGYTIGVYGIDERTAERGYEIYVPKAREEELVGMSLTGLLKYCEEENCKFQVRENGRVYIFSDVPGYTKAEVISAIKAAAEEKGIKVKIKK